LENLSFSDNWITAPLCALLGFVALFFISSCFILQFWTVDVHLSTAQTRNDDLDTCAGKEMMEKSRVKKVDVELVDLALEIYKPSLGRGPGNTSSILKSVSTKFQAGELNVIPGPSGSSKSLLLNAMARRLRSSLLTKYRTSGTVLFNGVQTTDKEVRSLCSYVTQDDSALLPYLSVRETLRFAAGLRLPAARNKQHEHTKQVSLEVILNAAIEVITPITKELGEYWISGLPLAVSDGQIGCIKAENATVEVIAPIVAKLKVAVEDVIVDVKVLASLPLERVLCTLVGGVLDALSIAKLLGCLLNVGVLNVLFGSPSLTPLYSSSLVLSVPFSLFSSSLSRPGSFPSSLRLAALSVLSSALCGVLVLLLRFSPNLKS
jgi:ABC-type dipeptide/oligopeptide/nickel transport system ATPase subunit